MSVELEVLECDACCGLGGLDRVEGRYKRCPRLNLYLFRVLMLMLVLVLVVRVLPSGSELSLLEACMLRVTPVLRLLVVRLSMKFLKTLRVCLSLLSGKVLAAQMMF